MYKLRVSKGICILFVFCAAAAIATRAQTTPVAPTVTFSTLHSFCHQTKDGRCTDGASPTAALVQGANGNLYGTTNGGGANSYGTVFQITTRGTLTTLQNFDWTDGSYPTAGLVLGTDGKFYGTTPDGGSHRGGTVFTVSSSGVLRTLHSFDHTDGENPYAGLVQGADGNFYGTTYHGGTNGKGTIFRITAGGALATLYSFCSQGGSSCTDGESPYAGLIHGADGKFYGTTEYGGANGDGNGTVFRITAGGTLTTLHSFDAADGFQPVAGLVQGADGMLYGTTYLGGANNEGTVFSITTGGVLRTLDSFCSQGGSSCTDGAGPAAALVQGANGDFYGTTYYGGDNDYGTVFRITTGDKLTTLHSFDLTDGYGPYAALVQATNGEFYGTTAAGGANGYGTIFRVSVGLGPFVETLPTAGKVGMTVDILGTNLTGASSVTFNGTAATFTVKSKSEITTTVPTGATAGTVKVVTPGGTLSSNVPFRVLP